MKKEVEAQPMVVTDIWDGTFMSLIYDPTLKMKKPDGAVEPSETVVGVLSPLERRLWSMSIHFKRLGMFEAIATDDAETEGEREVHKTAVGHLASRAKLIRDLMWQLIRDRLAAEGQELGDLTIGVREEWQIVAFESNDSPLDGLLKTLLSR